jgi:hypothetical protein
MKAPTDRTYTIQCVGEQSGAIHHVAHGVPHERLAELASMAREHGPKVAAVAAASRAASALDEAIGAVVDAFRPRPRARVRGKR